MRLCTGKREQRRDLHGIAPCALGALAVPITRVNYYRGPQSFACVPVPTRRAFPNY